MKNIIIWFEDWFLSRFNWYRQATDVQVLCKECDAPVGFVWKHGHKKWLCDKCSGTQETMAV